MDRKINGLKDRKIEIKIDRQQNRAIQKDTQIYYVKMYCQLE